MRLNLRVIQGPGNGLEYATGEQGCIIVGRDASGSRAHFRLPSRDRFVSRNHLLVEFQPPCCYVRDNGSRNGTFIKSRNDGAFRRISTARVEDGDLLRVGDTVLQVTLGEASGAEEQTACPECGADISEGLAARATRDLTYLDFICPSCRETMVSMAAAGLPPGSFVCAGCGGDVTPMANRDGRARLLGSTVSYLCDSCVATARKDGAGREIGDYLVLEEIGRGAMGLVCKAWHGPTGRIVALKTILPERAMAERASRIFHREIAVMRTLRHPHIVQLLDHGVFEGEHFLASEYIPDGSAAVLAGSERGGALPALMACDLICQVLEGLECAHDRGFIHRDIKPKNILLRRLAGGSIEAKLSDFGLAKSYMNAGQSGITRAGESGGTLFFAAPEQLTDFRHVMPPADLYSVGATLYFLLTGLLPFDIPSQAERVRGVLRGRGAKDPILAVLEEKPIPLRERNPGLPRGLASIVDKAIRKEVSARYQTARELREQLQLAMEELAGPKQATDL